MKNEIAAQLARGRRFAILSHLDPDGDAVGSALGLAWILRATGREAFVAMPGGVPRLYSFLAGAAEVAARADQLPDRFDAVVAVDATSPSRLAELESVLARGDVVLNVDHHGDNTRFGDFAWVDRSAAASALLVYDLARDAGWHLGEDAAACLYTGIVTDTGRFTFANTDARALAAAAELVERGAAADDIAHRIYEVRSAASTRLLARALGTLDMRDDGRVACVHVTPAMLAETGATPEDTEGFSNWARSIEGVSVGLFLRDTGNGAVRVSFRSNGGVAVDAIAGRFGGGGHPGASGARVPGPLTEAKESVLRAVSEALRHPV
ncbi:MAG: bifunctional oligoribonuclease/PAP phosphatase NrnA [bacterium]